LVRDVNGAIPLDSSLTTYDVGLTISSVSPDSNLNPNGGNVLTISGSSLPHSLEGQSITITFNGGGSCSIISSSSTAITCLTEGLSGQAGQTGITVDVSINGVTDSSLVVSVSSSAAAVLSITPDNYSPVLKTDLIIELSSDYTGSYDVDDFTVQIIPSDSSLKTRILNVYKIDSSTRKLTVRYGGANSNVYSLKVHSSSYGDIDTTGITFEAVGKVTALSPTSGSINGGTLLTITGYTFSDDGTDNQVNIGDNVCKIVESSET